MSTATLVAPAPVAPVVAKTSTTIPALHPVTAACADLRTALLQLKTGTAGASVLTARRAAAHAVAELQRRHADGPLAREALQVARELAESGELDQPADAEDLALAHKLAGASWPGLIATMLLVPAWQWRAAPRIEEVQAWMWPDYVAYLFANPQGFCATGQAEAYAAHALRRLEELARLAAVNRGSSQVREAVAAYVRSSNCIPMYFSTGSLRKHYEARGRLLKAAFGVPAQEELLPLSRDGRRLRVGFVNRHFAPQTESYTTLPTFEQRDPERFEVMLFVHHSGGSALENYARDHAASLQVLPPEFDAQLEVLRGALLDVVVFGTNVTAVVNEVTRLALHRIAPLQVVNNSSCTTTGLPEIDLYVSGTLTESAEAPEQFTERLALLPGPAHAFNYEADKQQPSTTWTRAALGLPEDATVFVTAANYFKIIPEMQEAWARLLAAVPGSRLLVHPFNPNWSSEYPIKRFRAGFERVLAAQGVAVDRLVVSTNRFPSRSDVKELLRVGDIYLDTFPFGGVNSLIDPLEIGMPVVAWEGATFRSRMGAALLRNLGLAEFVANDAASYHAICTGLAADAPRRAELRTMIANAMEQKPLFMDTLAASDAFGELLIQAHDELVLVGPQAFRQSKTVITPEAGDSADSVVTTVNYLVELGMHEEAMRQILKLLASDPASVEGRHLMGKVLLAQGKVPRALEYLLSAIHRGTAAAVVWRDLASALRRAGNRQGATSALETALRLDQQDVESWFLLAELAFECGHHDMFREIGTVVVQLAPDDPRTTRITKECAKLPAAATV